MQCKPPNTNITIWDYSSKSVYILHHTLNNTFKILPVQWNTLNIRIIKQHIMMYKSIKIYNYIFHVYMGTHLHLANEKFFLSTVNLHWLKVMHNIGNSGNWLRQ